MNGGATSDSVTVLLYSVNGTGLGHLTRLMAIARWVRTLLNGFNLRGKIFFLSCSEADFLLAANGFPSFKLPSRNALRDAQIPPDEGIPLIRRLAAGALDQIDPQIVIIDTFPTGTYDELLPILGRDDITKVFIFREQRPEYASAIPYEKLLISFQQMLIPHPEGSFPLTFDPPAALDVTWTGDIIFGERKELWTKQKVRETLGIPRNKTIVYSAAGGGGDREMSRYLQTLVDVAAEFPNVHLVVGVGPLNRQQLIQRPGVTQTTFYPISRMFGGFDFAISSSGYNSVNELIFFGLPAILFAQTRQADDQSARARRVADSGAAIAIDPFSADSLRSAMQRMMDPEVRRAVRDRGASLIPENGARRAAQAILRLALPRVFPNTEFPGLQPDASLASVGGLS